MIAAALLAVGSLQGCAATTFLFGPSNSVRQIELAQIGPAEKSAIIVIATRSEDPSAVGDLGILLSRYNPATRQANDCFEHDRIEVNVAAGQAATIYRAFKVPPGTYVLPWHLRTGSRKPDGFPAFIAQPGKVSFVGEFVRTPNLGGPAHLPRRHGFQLERDLVRAVRETGRTTAQLELAEIVPEPQYFPTLCTI